MPEDLTAPSLETLQDAKAFDDFKKSKNWKARLALLKKAKEPIAQIRYGWFLHYLGKAEEALSVLKPHLHIPLAKAHYMDALADLEMHEELLGHLKDWLDLSVSDAEATIIGYEVQAYVLAVLKRNYEQAFRILYRAEGLAIEHQLERRLAIIRFHLENVSLLSGKPVSLEAIHFDNLFSSQLLNITRFQSHLRAGNIDILSSYASFSPELISLAQSTLEYKRWIERLGDIEGAAKRVSSQISEYPEFRVYWSLLMLQIHSKIGQANGLASPHRIDSVLKQSLNEMKLDDINNMLSFSARVYPLGTLTASFMDKRLEKARELVAIICARSNKDGIRIGKSKYATITQRVRYALLNDGVNQSNEALAAVKALNPSYNNRLQKALGKVELELHETTNVGELYRSLCDLGKALNKSELSQQANRIKSENPYLQFISER